MPPPDIERTVRGRTRGTKDQKLMANLTAAGFPFQPPLFNDEYEAPTWELPPYVQDGVVPQVKVQAPIKIEIIGTKPHDTGKKAEALVVYLPTIGCCVSLARLPDYDSSWLEPTNLQTYALQASNAGIGETAKDAKNALRRSRQEYRRKITRKTYPKDTLVQPSLEELTTGKTPFEKLTPHFDAIYTDPGYIPGRVFFIEGNSVNTLANAQEIRNYLAAHQPDCQLEDARKLIGNAIETNKMLAEMNPKNKLLANHVAVYERIKDAFFTWMPLAMLENGIPMALACEIGFEELYIREIRASLIQAITGLWQRWNETPDGQSEGLSIADPSWFERFCFYYPDKITDIRITLTNSFREIGIAASLLKVVPYTEMAKKLKSLLVINGVDFQNKGHVQAIFERIVLSLRDLRTCSDQPMVLPSSSESTTEEASKTK